MKLCSEVQVDKTYFFSFRWNNVRYYFLSRCIKGGKTGKTMRHIEPQGVYLANTLTGSDVVHNGYPEGTTIEVVKCELLKRLYSV